MTRRTRASRVVAALVVPLLSVGCWFGTGSTSDVRWMVTDEIGMQLEPEFGMKAGRITLGFARFGLKLAGQHDISLKGLRKVEVGVYNVAERGVGARGVTDLDFPGWERIVRVKEDGEDVLVLVRTGEPERIKAMMVLVHDENELVVVRAKGKIHKLLERMVRKHGWSEIHRSFRDSVDVS